VDLGLAGKVAVITGGAGAICGQIARRLAEEGSDIVLADIAPAAGDAEEAVAAAGRRSFYVRCDVRRGEDVEAMVRRALERFGRIDILVNGAGGTTWAPVVQLEETEWDRIVETNLKGTFLCARAAGRQMIAQRSGKIVNIASGLGHTPSAEVGHYAAAKAGVIALGKTLALEFAPYGIHVNSVAPGIVDTPFVAPRRSREEIRAIGARIPLGRVGLPDDVARAVVFLASAASDYITGQTLFVNGGALMP
jgi:3-oxoacyl-[acyl-carrier protein] reductase